MHIDADSQLHHAFDQHFALECPHCQVLSHLSAVSTPKFEQLMRFKPQHAGIVYRCDSCNSPVFLKFAVKSYGTDRVELASSYHEIERPKETFDFTHLPEDAEELFREALSCYSSSCFNAFASMCRRTAQSIFADLGENGKLRIFDELNEIRDLAEIDEDTFGVVKKVVFDRDIDARTSIPLVDAAQAGILLEMMKDMLYQAYVRRGKLQAAMMMRRYLAADAGPDHAPSEHQ